MWNNTTLAITGGTMNAQGGVGIKGNSTYDNTNIKISGNTSINAKETDIYPPQGGNITISGGTINGIGEADEHSPIGIGFASTGDALPIAHYNKSTNSENYGTPVVTVTGGVFTSANGKVIASYANPNANVNALNGFISGGTFSVLFPKHSVLTDILP